jgi:hypothetical protein
VSQHRTVVGNNNTRNRMWHQGQNGCKPRPDPDEAFPHFSRDMSYKFSIFVHISESSRGTLLVLRPAQWQALRFFFHLCHSFASLEDKPERTNQGHRSEESQSNTSLLRLFASLRVTKKDFILSHCSRTGPSVPSSRGDPIGLRRSVSGRQRNKVKGERLRRDL